jgi:type IV pilus assembly protein PilV
MTTELKPRALQSGAYLLEALIGILIFALGVLGIVGLQAASLRTTANSSLRSEAVFAATQITGQMWADKYVNLVGNYSSATLGATYVEWAADLKAAQGGAWFQDPTVDFTNGNAACNPNPDPFSATVYILILWQSPDGVTPGPVTTAAPGGACGATKCHWYATCAVIGQNVNTP